MEHKSFINEDVLHVLDVYREASDPDKLEGTYGNQQLLTGN